MLSKHCETCGKEFYKKKTEGRKRWEKRKYCCFKCSTVLSEEETERRKERLSKYRESETSEMLKERMSKVISAREKNGTWFPPMTGKTGGDCPHWLGENAQYNGKHRWIQKHWEKTGICEECGDKPVSRGRNRWGTQWSNNDHKYNRGREHWQELCPKCHKKKDKQLRIASM